MDLISRCLLHKKRKIVFKIYIPFTNDVCLPTKEKLFEGYLLPSTKWGQKLEENKVPKKILSALFIFLPKLKHFGINICLLGN